jgi:hypothetical protein
MAIGRICLERHRLHLPEKHAVPIHQWSLLSKSKEFALDGIIFQFAHLVGHFAPSNFSGDSLFRHIVIPITVDDWNSDNFC